MRRFLRGLTVALDRIDWGAGWQLAWRTGLLAGTFVLVVGSTAQSWAVASSPNPSAPSNAPEIIAGVSALSTIIVTLIAVVGKPLMDHYFGHNPEALISALADEHARAEAERAKAVRLESEINELRRSTERDQRYAP